MNVLFVMDPLAGLQPEVDATVGLMVSAQDLDVDVWCCGTEDLSLVAGRLHVRAQRVSVRPRRRGRDHRWVVEPTWWDDLETAVLDVAETFEVVQLRIDPPVDARYLHATYLLEVAEAAGVRVSNRPSGIRELHEKIAALRWPHLCPATTVSARVAELRAFVAEHGTTVVKPVDGFAGGDVWLVRNDATAASLLESATAGGHRHVIVQTYLPDVQRGNKRLFLLDGEVIGAVLRRPAADDFRIGPPVAAVALDADDERIVAAVGPELVRLGLTVAGIDVIAGRLIEINVTCPGGMAKSDALLGTDLSGTITRRLLAPCSFRSGPSHTERLLA